MHWRVEVEVGRKLGADFIISGRITQAGSYLFLTLRLFNTVDGRLITSADARGKSVDQLIGKTDSALSRLVAPLGDQTPSTEGTTASPPPGVWPAPTGPSQGTLKLISTPSSAKVSIDGDAAGATPLIVKRQAGAYILSIEMPGYAPVSRQIDLAAVENGGTAQVSLFPRATQRADDAGDR